MRNLRLWQNKLVCFENNVLEHEFNTWDSFIALATGVNVIRLFGIICATIGILP
jgi:hypothetical protein